MGNRINPEDEVRDVLRELPSEYACVDYKCAIYQKINKHDFVKDVIAMLNSEEGIGSSKIIIMGITDKPRERKGVNIDEWKDDNEWQNLLDKISPRPLAYTGYVTYEGRDYAYIYIYAENFEWVYEVRDTVIGDKSEQVIKESKGAFKGQAFTRKGSRTDILDQKGRERLAKKRVQFKDYNYISPDRAVVEKDSFIVAALLGSWNEKYDGDISAIKQLSGKPIGSFIEDIRKISYEQPGLLSFRNKVWSSNNQEKTLLAVAANIYDDAKNEFFRIAERVFLDKDPKYDLPSDQRFASRIIQKEKTKTYSYELLTGIAKTIAILGNNEKEFVNTSRYKIKQAIASFEHTIIGSEDWKVYATIADTYQYLAEAYPKVFLEEIEEKLKCNDAAFIEYMDEKDDSIFTANYGYQVIRAVSLLAQQEEYFSRAFRIMVMLADKWDRFIPDAVGIVLPWFPQTHATAKVRVGAISGLKEEYDNTIWDILMRLMPGVTTIGSPLHEPEYMKMEPIPQVTRIEYAEVSIDYIDIACGMMHNDVNRMMSVIDVLDDVDDSERKKIISSLRTDAEQLTYAEKTALWNKTQDFVTRHKRFSYTEWALSDEDLLPVEKFAEDLLPDSREALSIRLFREDQYRLFDYYSDSDPQRRLVEEQSKIIGEQYEKGSLEAIKTFSDKVEAKRLVGRYAENYLSNEEILELILTSKDILKEELLIGIIRNVQFDRLVEIIHDCDEIKKAIIVSRLELSDETVEYIGNLSKAAQEKYWEKVEFLCGNVEKEESITIVSEALVNAGRPEVSIRFLYMNAFDGKIEIDSRQIIIALKSYAVKGESQSADIYELQFLIKWLQDKAMKSGCEFICDLIEIEWQYLNILNPEDDCEPVMLWREMSNEGEFFVDVIKGAYGYSSHFQGVEITDAIKTHLWKLLFKWKRTPGTGNDGFIDPVILGKWMTDVEESCSEEELKKIAMTYFGKASFYAPQDRDGFFIDRGIAKSLIRDGTGEALRGFANEEINSRGVVIVDPTGEEEFRIEASYREKALLSEQEGYLKLADAYREIADSHHEEGERNKELSNE